MIDVSGVPLACSRSLLRPLFRRDVDMADGVGWGCEHSFWIFARLFFARLLNLLVRGVRFFRLLGFFRLLIYLVDLVDLVRWVIGFIGF